MTEKIDIICTGLVDSGRSPRVVGTIAWKLGNEVFPDENWSDFPCVILDWWLSELTMFSRGGTKLRFMDGPLWLEVGPVREGRVRVQGFKNRLSRPPQELTSVHESTLDALTSALVRSAEEVLKFCRQHEIHDPDMEALSRHVASRTS